jgi:hypothetical protein
MTDCAQTHYSKPGFNVAVDIPGHGGDPVTRINAFFLFLGLVVATKDSSNERLRCD